jgi:hypothetical protein
MLLAALLALAGCQKKQGAEAEAAVADSASAQAVDSAVVDSASALVEDTASARRVTFEVIRKDYQYKIKGAEFDIHLENVGNSDKVYNLVNKLIYENKNFDEYKNHTEKTFLDGADDAERFELQRNCSVLCNDDTHIVFKDWSWEYTGGAHGNGFTEYIIIDLVEGKKLDIKDLINPVPDELLDKIIKSENENVYYLRENIWPPDAVNFCGKKIELMWYPYSITPYALGQLTIEVPRDVINKYLTNKGKMLSGL